MKRKFKITAINHSGRKGLRDTPCKDEKYNGLLDHTILFDPENTKQFDCIHWTVTDSRRYEWWDTSPTLALMGDENGNYLLETANTIYKLREINE